jgi:hypothetical protein
MVVACLALRWLFSSFLNLLLICCLRRCFCRYFVNSVSALSLAFVLSLCFCVRFLSCLSCPSPVLAVPRSRRSLSSLVCPSLVCFVSFVSLVSLDCLVCLLPVLPLSPLLWPLLSFHHDGLSISVLPFASCLLSVRVPGLCRMMMTR